MTTPTSPTKVISRSQAKAWTLGAQLVAAGFVLGAVALGVIGLPEPSIAPRIDPAGNAFENHPAQPATGAKAQTNAGSAFSQQIDIIGLAERFALLDNAPTIPPPTPVTAPSDPDPAPTQVYNEIVKRVRYIGFINEPGSRHAFIRIDGKQRIVALGEVAKAGAPEFPDLTVERITPNHIVMTDGDKRAQIMLATRTGQSITLVGGGQVKMATPAENGSVLTAEDEATILALPPRQQPTARRRLERERRGLSPDPKPRRPAAKPLGTARGSLRRNRPDRED